MHEPGKYKVHDAGLQAWLRYQKIQPLYWERYEHGVHAGCNGLLHVFLLPLQLS